MDIEKQRWEPLPLDWVKPPPGGFPWKVQPPGSFDNYGDPFETMESEDGWFLSDIDFRSQDGAWAGVYFSRVGTEFDAEPDAWRVLSGSYDEIVSWTPDVFVQESGQGSRPGRIIDIDISEDGTFNVIFVPNYDGFYRKQWFHHGVSHTSTVKKLINGEAVAQSPAGPKKRLVTITQHPTTRHMSFVLEEWKKGEAFWWGVGLTATEVMSIAHGNGAAAYPQDFPPDNIPKRLVLLQGHRNFATQTVMTQPAQDVWVQPGDPREEDPSLNPFESGETYDPHGEENEGPALIHVPAKYATETVPLPDTYLFMMVPNDQGLKWQPFWRSSWTAIDAFAEKNSMRVIDLHPFDTDQNLFSAVVLQHAS